MMLHMLDARRTIRPEVGAMYPLEAKTETIKIAETETDHAVLADIRKATQSMRAMMIFFTVIASITVFGLLFMLAHYIGVNQ
jgi:hypothetical protein